MSSGGSTMSRRDRLILAVVGVAILYVLAVLFFFNWWKGAWSLARKNYEKAKTTLAGERQLIADRAYWQERLEQSQLQMPIVGEDDLPSTHWKAVVESLAQQNNFHIVSFSNDGREEDLGEVWELAIDIEFRSSLRRLVEFFYTLQTTEEGLFDVRMLEINGKKPGVLSGKFTLTCAYKKGSF